MQFGLTRWRNQLAECSTQRLGSSHSAPIAPESRGAKATASACPAESVCLNPGLGTSLAPYRRRGQTQGRLHSRPSYSRQRVSKPLPLTGELPQNGRKPLVAGPQSPDRSEERRVGKEC